MVRILNAPKGQEGPEGVSSPLGMIGFPATSNFLYKKYSKKSACLKPILEQSFPVTRS